MKVAIAFNHSANRLKETPNSQSTPSPKWRTILDLPDELLVAIFQLCVEGLVANACQQRFPRLDSPPGISMAYFWVKIRHVCRLWRNIACHYPSLNTHVVLAHPGCVAEQVHRSSDLPLSVYLIHDYPKLSLQATLEACRLVFKEATRIRRVVFQWTTPLDAAFQNTEFAATEFPMLEDITLHPVSPASADTQRSYLSTPFSKVSLPKLMSYHCVGGMSFPHLFSTLLHKPLQKTLRHLVFTAHLERNPFQHVVATSVHGLFDLLDELSRLEELELYVTSLIHAVDPGWERKTILRRLERLHLSERGGSGVAPWLLARIVCPPTTCTTIETEVTHSSLRDGVEKQKALDIASHITDKSIMGEIALGEPHFMKLDVCHGKDYMEIALWTADQTSATDDATLQPPPPILRWKVHNINDPQLPSLRPFLSHIFELLPLSSVIGLLIDHDACRQDHFAHLSSVVHSLGHLPEVRVLGTHGPWLLHEIARATKGDMSVFPHLQHWCIRGLESPWGMPQPEWSVGIWEMFRRLGLELIRRYKAGTGLKMLHIDSDCVFAGEALGGDVAVLLSPRLTGRLDGFKWTPGSLRVLDISRVCSELMRITNGAMGV